MTPIAERTAPCATLCLALSLVTSAAWAQDIRAVDFRNRVWRDTCAGTVRTHNGEYAGNSEEGIRQTFSVEASVFGDLDGDGADEAVVTTWCNGGGTGQFSNATVFAWRGGRLRELARLGEGDRADGGLTGVRIERGVIVEERALSGSTPLAPAYAVTFRRALRDGRLVDVAPATVLCPDLEPDCALPSGRPQSVRFEPGTTSAARWLTFDARGRLAPLDLWMRAGQDLAGAAACQGTELAAVRVEPPGGPAVESAPSSGSVRVQAARAGRARVTVTAQRPVGLCWVQLSIEARPAAESPRWLRRR